MPHHTASGTPGHLILVGLPGAGKTTVGRAVAEKLGRPFLDFDEEIERRKGVRVADIFGRRGESYFRSLERALTEELVAAPAMVLAPGGGWITVPGVVALLRPPGRIIHLRVRPETAIVRLGKNMADRPLLRVPDPLAALQHLLERREPYYRCADAVLDVDLLDVQQVTEIVARVAGWREGG
jgi:shikimate kinase